MYSIEKKKNAIEHKSAHIPATWMAKTIIARHTLVTSNSSNSALTFTLPSMFTLLSYTPCRVTLTVCAASSGDIITTIYTSFTSIENIKLYMYKRITLWKCNTQCKLLVKNKFRLHWWKRNSVGDREHQTCSVKRKRTG